MQRIPSLDGLRALSILLVIFGHLSKSFAITPIAYWGELGVRIFFVISGFLITTLLEKERIASQTVSLRAFYVRRALRILPLAYFFIATIALLRLASPRDLFFASTYLMSYRLNPGANVAHLWSLSVEEQFYLLWPLGFLIAGENARRWTGRVFLAAPFLRLGWWIIFPQYRALIGVAFPTVLDSIAIGCFAALSPRVVRETGFINRFVAVMLPFLTWLIIAVPNYLPSGLLRSTWRFLGDSVADAMLALFVVWCINDRGLVYDLLNLRKVVFVGTISYSLYIWQQVFVGLSTPTVVGGLWRLGAIFAVAIAAHYLVERPFLGMKDRLSNLRRLKLEAARA